MSTWLVPAVYDRLDEDLAKWYQLLVEINGAREYDTRRLGSNAVPRLPLTLFVTTGHSTIRLRAQCLAISLLTMARSKARSI